MEDLILNRQWNHEFIRHIFLPINQEIILNIPLSYYVSEDLWIWHYDLKGLYSVRSGYKLFMHMRNSQCSSGGHGDGVWWKKLWNLQIPSKIKNFMWRAVSGFLSTFTNLARRGINYAARCQLCGVEEETILHALWTCPLVIQVWEICALSQKLKLIKAGYFEALYVFF